MYRYPSRIDMDKIRYLYRYSGKTLISIRISYISTDRMIQITDINMDDANRKADMKNV
jgi:hypothetical protein